MPASVEWNNFEYHALKPSANKEAVPFLRLSDGGLIAFWFRDGLTPIIHIGAHAELEVIATDFGRFLTAINMEQTGLSDFDDAEPPLQFPIAQTMIRDGHSKVYTLDALWWFMNFQITISTTGINITMNYP